MRKIQCGIIYFITYIGFSLLINLSLYRYSFIEVLSVRVKVIPLMTFLALAFTINTHAVDVQVPAGNRPLSGADSSIPANAYETYTTGSQ